MAKRLTEEAAVLAATRAALDPRRGNWQHDILVSTVLEVLERKGTCSQRQLSEYLRGSWIGQWISPGLLTSVLEVAQEQGLIQAVDSRQGRRQWQVTEATRLEVKTDRSWAQGLLQRVQGDIAHRLTAEFPDEDDLASKAEVLMRALIRAMIKATRNVFRAVESSASPRDLRDVRVNLRAVVPELRREVSPPALAEFTARLALAAADPADSFGEDLLETLVSGQILHGMVSRADVEGPAPVTDLFLDTSALLLLSSHEPRVVDLMHEFFQTAQQLGCRMYVTDRVVEEWDKHWEKCTEMESKLRQRFGDAASDLLVAQDLLSLGNYARARELGENASFSEWAKSRRNLTAVLDRYGVETLDSEEVKIDLAFVVAVATEIDECQRRMGSRGKRNRGQRRRMTDGVSCALVRQSRLAVEPGLVPNAWFVAHDQLTGEAYGSVAADDPFPLTTTPAAWLVFYSAFGVAAGDPIELIDRVTEGIVLDAFISVAASYTGEEMLALGDLLSEDDALSADDVQDLVTQSFLSEPGKSLASPEELARARVARQSQRAVRALQDQSNREREAEVERQSQLKRISDLESKGVDDSAAEARLRRVIWAMAVGFVAVCGALLFTFVGPDAPAAKIATWMGTALFGLWGYLYVKSEKTVGVFLVGVVAEAILIALGLLLDNGLGFGNI